MASPAVASVSLSRGCCYLLDQRMWNGTRRIDTQISTKDLRALVSIRISIQTKDSENTKGIVLYVMSDVVDFSRCDCEGVARVNCIYNLNVPRLGFFMYCFTNKKLVITDAVGVAAAGVPHSNFQETAKV